MKFKVLSFLFLAVFLFSCKAVKEGSQDGSERSSTRLSSQNPIYLESKPPQPTSKEENVIQPAPQSIPPEAQGPTEIKRSEDFEAIPSPELGKPQPQQSVTQEIVPFKPKILDSKTNIDILVDTSGSMTGLINNSSLTKFDTLKDALFTILDEIVIENIQRNIGIRRYGGKCDESELTYPMSEINQKEIKARFEKITLQGESPLIYALNKSKDDFGTLTGDKTILVITDGADSCKKNLCQNAKDIFPKNSGFIVEVIGYDLNDEDRSELECLAKENSGNLRIARNPTELFSNLEEAINVGVPYNLKLVVTSSNAFLPSVIKVFKSGTQVIAKESVSPGVKHFSLPPGTYDVKIEYTETKENPQPSKMIKGVEIMAGTKIEQKVDFDLAPITLTSIDENKQNVPAKYEIFKAGTNDLIASIEQNQPNTIFISQGKYDVVANRLDEPMGYSLKINDFDTQINKSLEHTFKFQKGAATLRAKDSKGNAIPFNCKIYTEDTPDRLIAEENITQEGKEIKLQPGKYILKFSANDSVLPIIPTTTVNAEVKPDETTPIVGTFKLSPVIFSAMKGNANIPAKFTLKAYATDQVLGELSTADGKPLQTEIPPGEYDVLIESSASMNIPRPTLEFKNIKIGENLAKPEKIEGIFKLGELRLRATDQRQRSINTEFTVRLAGEDIPLLNQQGSGLWLILDLPPATYDITARKLDSESITLPTIKLTDIKVEEGKSTSHEAIFTSGKIKIIARTANNKIITCEFKIFEYGSDGELISGSTGDDWQNHEIAPGKYYIEASYRDPIQAVTLKKWVNLSVGENEVVEKVLRF